ncbi:Uncharacterized protein dnm_052470 [Desulfonema magnum]|uniref:Uncharacterized protein n=1 Tax=Desulfonema magnum TaxID=45655 RepID=A0A975BPA2_9BACT|nr:Uncharacterized protein dnm_052470 [Desulfonema magnum]
MLILFHKIFVFVSKLKKITFTITQITKKQAMQFSFKKTLTLKIISNIIRIQKIQELFFRFGLSSFFLLIFIKHRRLHRIL